MRLSPHRDHSERQHPPLDLHLLNNLTTPISTYYILSAMPSTKTATKTTRTTKAKADTKAKALTTGHPSFIDMITVSDVTLDSWRYGNSMPWFYRSASLRTRKTFALVFLVQQSKSAPLVRLVAISGILTVIQVHRGQVQVGDDWLAAVQPQPCYCQGR